MEKLNKSEDKKSENEPGSKVSQETPETETQEPITPSTSEKKTGKKGKLQFLKNIVRSKKFRIAAPIVLLILIAIAVFVQPVKFAFLNLVSNGEAKFVVVDDVTLAAVSGAKIKVANQTVQTDKKGNATVKKLDFGEHKYTIEKETYTAKSGKVLIKPGDNLVGPVKIHSNGFPIEVRVTNKLSASSVKTFSVSVEGTDISAQANKEGVAIVKFPSKHLGKQTLVIKADGFNKTSQEITIDLAQKQNPLAVTLTPSGKHYFLSNRDGKMGVYAANLDGSEPLLIVAGTGTEDQSTTLSVSPDRKHGILVTKRDNQRAPNGALLQAVYSVDFEAKSIKRIDEGAPSFTTLGWIDNNRAAYQLSYDDFQRAENIKLKTVEVASNKLTTVATFPYAFIRFFKQDPQRAYVQQSDASKPDYGLYTYNLTTRAKQQLFQESGGDIVQTDPGKISFLTMDNKAYDVILKTQRVEARNQINFAATRVYVPSPDDQRLGWTEDRDGKGAVIVGSSSGSDPKQLTRDIPVSVLVDWVGNDYIIFRSIANTTTADYIVDTANGTTTKISDVFAQQKYSGF